MIIRRASQICALLAILSVAASAAPSADRPIHIKLGLNGRFFVDNRPVFPIGFSEGPAVGAKTPEGNNAIAELAKNGFVFFRWVSPRKQPWGPEKEKQLDDFLAEADRTGTKVAIYIGPLTEIPPGDQNKIAELDRVIKKYRDNPAVFLWKGADEPQWAKIAVQNVDSFSRQVHRLDPNHPVWITQAPRGTIEQLRPYAKTYDVGAVDIFPITYPPGTHSGIANKNISVVGDYALRMGQVDGESKGLMMTLQICWAGVIQPGKTLRMPTFPEERYMSYQAIIDGARALLYRNGANPKCMSEEDRTYGWNWRFYRRTLEPVLEEFRPQSPLYPALIAPNSSLPVHVAGGSGLEFAVREAGEYVYVLAAKREGDTLQFTFTGLPQGITDGQVLFESPRHVSVANGKFTDWFGPNEVHVYRFRRPARVRKP